MEALRTLLAHPSVANWKEIVKIGKHCLGKPDWQTFSELVLAAVPSWPKEIQRPCPDSWPVDFREKVQWLVREVDTYGHYAQKICGDPRLQLEGKQRVWLERRFTGGVVPASTAQQVIGTLLEACGLKSLAAVVKLIREAVAILAGSIRNTGKIGTADLTGGLVIQRICGRCGCGSGRHCYMPVRIEVRLEIEIKVGDGKQRPDQAAREASVRARGGCYVLCYSVEEAIEQILRFIAQHEQP